MNPQIIGANRMIRINLMVGMFDLFYFHENTSNKRILKTDQQNSGDVITPFLIFIGFLINNYSGWKKTFIFVIMGSSFFKNRIFKRMSSYIFCFGQPGKIHAGLTFF